jgi:serine/threonine protein kinase
LADNGPPQQIGAYTVLSKIGQGGMGAVYKANDPALAKSLREASVSVTSTGTIMGSAQYISPEQARGEKEIDFRTDIYSLGCTLFHMLTGRVPFEGAETMGLLYKHAVSNQHLAGERPALPPVPRLGSRPEFYGSIDGPFAAERITLDRVVLRRLSHPRPFALERHATDHAQHQRHARHQS